jgi:hypothetical protein
MFTPIYRKIFKRNRSFSFRYPLNYYLISMRVPLDQYDWDGWGYFGSLHESYRENFLAGRFPMESREC